MAALSDPEDFYSGEESGGEGEGDDITYITIGSSSSNVNEDAAAAVAAAAATKLANNIPNHHHRPSQIDPMAAFGAAPSLSLSLVDSHPRLSLEDDMERRSTSSSSSSSSSSIKKASRLSQIDPGTMFGNAPTPPPSPPPSLPTNLERVAEEEGGEQQQHYQPQKSKKEVLPMEDSAASLAGVAVVRSAGAAGRKLADSPRTQRHKVIHEGSREVPLPLQRPISDIPQKMTVTTSGGSDNGGYGRETNETATATQKPLQSPERLKRHTAVTIAFPEPPPISTIAADANISGWTRPMPAACELPRRRFNPRRRGKRGSHRATAQALVNLSILWPGKPVGQPLTVMPQTTLCEVKQMAVKEASRVYGDIMFSTTAKAARKMTGGGTVADVGVTRRGSVALPQIALEAARHDSPHTFFWLARPGSLGQDDLEILVQEDLAIGAYLPLLSSDATTVLRIVPKRIWSHPGTWNDEEHRKELEATLGEDIARILADDNPEVLESRALLSSYALAEARRRDTLAYALALRVSSNPAPSSLTERYVKGCIRLCVYFDDDLARHCVRVVLVGPNALPYEALTAAFPDTQDMREKFGVAATATPEDYVLKVPERSEYLHGDYKISCFRHVRSLLLADIPIFLRAVPFASVTALVDAETEAALGPAEAALPSLRRAAYHESNKPSWEESSSTTGTNNNATVDAQSSLRHHSEVFAFSLWDLPTSLQVIVETLDNLLLPRSANYLSISLTLVLGSDAITMPVLCDPVAVADCVVLAKPCIFDTPLSHLPLESKLLCRVNGYKKLRSERAPDYELAWCILPLFDHNGTMSQGQHHINLRSGPPDIFSNGGGIGGDSGKDNAENDCKQGRGLGHGDGHGRRRGSHSESTISLSLPVFTVPVHHPMAGRKPEALAKLPKRNSVGVGGHRLLSDSKKGAAAYSARLAPATEMTLEASANDSILTATPEHDTQTTSKHGTLSGHVSPALRVDNTGDETNRLIELPGQLVTTVVALATRSSGVVTRERRFMLKRHRHTFTGRELVDWFQERSPDRSRTELIRLGQELLRLRVIKNVAEDYELQDSTKQVYTFRKFSLVRALPAHYAQHVDRQAATMAVNTTIAPKGALARQLAEEAEAVDIKSVQAKMDEAKERISRANREIREGKRLAELRRTDLLATLSGDDLALIWRRRADLVECPPLLPKFLRATDWGRRDEVREACQMMVKWSPISPFEALELLFYNQPSAVVRSYAVARLDTMSDDDLEPVLLQLVQTLRFEAYHNSSIARFLLRRALHNRRVGLALFWQLAAQLSDASLGTRCGIMLEAYLAACGQGVRRQLDAQAVLIAQLEQVSDSVKATKAGMRNAALRGALAQLPVQIAQPAVYDCSVLLGTLLPATSFVLDSKQRPLWLEFRNADGQTLSGSGVNGARANIVQMAEDAGVVAASLLKSDTLTSSSASSFPAVTTTTAGSRSNNDSTLIKDCTSSDYGAGGTIDSTHPATVPPRTVSVQIIYKAGDDLRQDMMTLQLLRLMDKIWQDAGLDLRMLVYGCVATGPDSGIIEVVSSSKTVASIQRAAGGSAAAFSETPLRDWLRTQNVGEDTFESARDNFIRSCAGYCVATYVLGIGDRHNDNIMVHKDGRFFHIDFGHFLGNTKSKFGVNRERAPFVLTPDFVYAMGSRDSQGFRLFVKLCCRAFAVLRRHAQLLLALFALLLKTGIPELTEPEDIDYVRNALALDLTEEAAERHFEGLIDECLEKSWATQVNFWFHNLAH